MAITQQFEIDMIPQTVPVVVPVNQYDTGTGRLIVKLKRGTSDYTPSSATAQIQGTKPDKHGFQYSASISGNTVTADLTQQMTACPGDVRTQIVVTESSGKTGTFAFILRVQPSALADDTDISDTELPAIIDAAETNAERAEAAAAHYPYINQTNKHWMVYNTSTGQFEDTNVVAKGEDGRDGIMSATVTGKKVTFRI